MSTKKMTTDTLLLLMILGCVKSLIVPEELPTILSLIYSNIPPVKKGTDSRLGVGFRLGEHADFQVMVELGPQKDTDPIGNAVDSKRKRAAIMSSALKGELGPWAQAVAKHQIEQKLKTIMKKYKVNTEESQKIKDKNGNVDSKTVGSDWLSKWSNGPVFAPAEDPPFIETRPITQRGLPHVNRIRVVNGPTNSESETSAQNDLQNLKKLFGTDGVNKTNSIN